MDTGAVRPLPIQVISPSPRAPEATTPVAKTDIPEAQAVSPARETLARLATFPEARDESRDKAQGVAVERRLKRENIRDSVTDTLVFREVDETSGEVIRQIPRSPSCGCAARLQTQSSPRPTPQRLPA
ncbi:hypothetical protein [Breoghania sp. L-A4]|uniref:hypothetical protein n=1 Tax=Breoghania sp. L-A4 TaxID=2304600 RepID=UPI0013C30EA4|nr:hypothetical protein [Breoghania sp. L-A4]